MDTDSDWSFGVETSCVFTKVSIRTQNRHIYLCLNKRPAHIIIRSVQGWAHSPPRAFVVCLCTDWKITQLLRQALICFITVLCLSKAKGMVIIMEILTTQLYRTTHSHLGLVKSDLLPSFGKHHKRHIWCQHKSAQRQFWSYASISQIALLLLCLLRLRQKEERYPTNSEQRFTTTK